MYKIFFLLFVSFLAGCSSPQIKKSDFIMPEPVEPKEIVSNPYSIYNGNSFSLFEERARYNEGDIVIIKLSESTSANKTSSTSTSKSGNTSIDNPTLFGNPVEFVLGDLAPSFLSLDKNKTRSLETTLGSSNSFAGSGASSQSNSLDGFISAYVTKVYSNGNLKIEGVKKLVLNKGVEYVKVTGVVRARDIDADNTVDSTKIAGADIVYSGEGFINDSQEMGWLSRFFNSSNWLY
mgnify:CR=1 FL=1